MNPRKAPDALRVRLTETHTFTRHFEVTGWHEHIECPPQEHLARLRDNPRSGDYFIRFNGTLTKRHTPAPHGAHADDPHHGKAQGAPATRNLTIDAYRILQILETLNDPTAPFTLDPAAPILINAIEVFDTHRLPD